MHYIKSVFLYNKLFNYKQRLNVIDKSIIVILNKLTNGKLKNVKKKKNVFLKAYKILFL